MLFILYISITMPRLGPRSDNDDPYSTDKKALSLSRSLSGLDIHGSTHAAHAQPRPQQPCRKPATNNSGPSSTPNTKGSVSISGSRSREVVKHLLTPSSSPERPPRKRKDSNKQIRKSNPRYLTPPPSDDENDTSSGTAASESDQSLEFPLDRRPLPTARCSTTAIVHDKTQILNRRTASTGTRPLDPKPSTDRFITARASAYDLSYAFRATKATQDLTKSEKLLRDSSASPDPFGRIILPRLREQRVTASRGRVGPSQTNRHHSRTIGTLNTIALPQDISAPQNRQVSAGAVWNVGGSAHTGQTGPVRAISNGRGGFLSSGSNAPMYTAEFLDRNTQDQEIETMENRVARALDINRTERLINTNRSVREPRRTSTGSIGLKKKHYHDGYKTKWVNGEWVRSCSSREYLPPRTKLR